MTDVVIRCEGRAGRITLDRPGALNALTANMCCEIETAIDRWRDDGAVESVLLDAEGDRAFCAGGDIADLHATGMAGDFGFGQRFWREEYRLNAKLHGYPKPVVSFLQGFTMGGGVGLGCHARLRIVGESSHIAMPECSIGLVPDVGGSMILARAPGRLGAYLGLTGTRMGPADAILAGFADTFLPEAEWPEAKARICFDGWPVPGTAAPPGGRLEGLRAEVDRLFASHDLGAILAALEAEDSDFATETRTILGRNSPLAMACTLEMLRRLGPAPGIAEALSQEYRFTSRAMERGDFLEGVRAAIIDRDRAPSWRHDGPPPRDDIDAMLAPLGAGAPEFTEREWS